MDQRVNGLPFKLRDARELPQNGNCKTHLRRICGVCAHFSGQEMRAGGLCRKYGRSVRGLRDAGLCELWERKTAPS